MKYVLAVLSLGASLAPAIAQQAPSSPAPAASPANGGFDPAATPTPAPSESPATILLPGGTDVDVSLAESVTSAKATVGDTVPIVVDREVDAGGYVVIPKGSNGQATIAQVDRAGGNGHGGKLGLTMDWVYSADHGKVMLSNVNHSTGEETDKKGAASTATILSYALLGPLGLFAHNFVRGRDVTVGTTQVFHVFIDHDVHIRAVQRVVAPAGFDN